MCCFHVEVVVMASMDERHLDIVSCLIERKADANLTIEVVTRKFLFFTRGIDFFHSIISSPNNAWL